MRLTSPTASALCTASRRASTGTGPRPSRSWTSRAPVSLAPGLAPVREQVGQVRGLLELFTVSPNSGPGTGIGRAMPFSDTALDRRLLLAGGAALSLTVGMPGASAA